MSEENKIISDETIVDESGQTRVIESIEMLPAKKPPSTMKLFWREMRHDPFAMVGLVVFIGILLFLIIASMIIGTEAALARDLHNRLMAPSWVEGGAPGYILGTDPAGRNIFYLLVISGRNSIFLGFSISIISIIIGVVIGIVSGFYGGHVDNVVMRIVDTWMMLPSLMIMIVLISMWDTFTMTRFIFLLVAFTWMGRTRLIRSMALQQRHMDYVAASKTLGTRNVVIIFREVMPNLVSIIMANVVLTMAGSIGIETGLTLLGYGLPIDSPSLGTLINHATTPAHLQNRWWLWFPAILMVFIIMLSINFIGQAVSRAADPQQRMV